MIIPILIAQLLFASISTVINAYEGSGSVQDDLEWYEKELLTEMISMSDKNVNEMTSSDILDLLVSYEERKVQLGLSELPVELPVEIPVDQPMAMPLKSPRMMASSATATENNAKSGVIMNFNGNGPITNHIYYINFIHQHQEELAKEIDYIFSGYDENVAKNMFHDVLERVNEEIGGNSEIEVQLEDENGSEMKDFDYIDQAPVDVQSTSSSTTTTSTTTTSTTTTSTTTTSTTTTPTTTPTTTSTTTSTTTTTTTSTTTTTTTTTTTVKTTASTTTKKPITVNVAPIITLKMASESKKTGSSCPVCKSKNIWACFGKNVKTKKCRSNEGCSLDFRSRNGKIEMIEMGCKQMKACKNEMKQNGKTPNWGRCRPNSKSWSHCRQCCSGPHCQSRLAPFKFKDYQNQKANWNKHL